MGMYGRTLLWAAERLRGSKSLHRLAHIANAPFARPDEARRSQMASLQALLKHAEQKVPYYRELFRQQGVRAEEIRTLEDFSRLPILTKDLVRGNLDDLIRDDVDRDSLHSHSSGGSTGVPLTFFSQREYLDWSEAGTYRNFLQCGWKPGEMVAFFWGDDSRLIRMSHLEFELRQHLRRVYQFSAFRCSRHEMDNWLQTFRRVRPVIAYGYPSVMARFAQHILKSDTKLPKLKGVFSTAERLYSWQREVMGEAFGSQVFDCYGSSEVRNIASECPHGRMHVNTDFVVLEALPSQRPESDLQHLVLTSLVNYGMPFIRYLNEDTGRLEEGTCECGRGFPLMELEVSRVTDSFRLPNGRVVHGLYFTYLLYGEAGVDSFRFYQPELDRIEVMLQPTAGWTAGQLMPLMKRIRKKIDELAPDQLRITLELVDQIPRSVSGKHRYTESDVGPASNPSFPSVPPGDL